MERELSGKRARDLDGKEKGRGNSFIDFREISRFSSFILAAHVTDRFLK